MVLAVNRRMQPSPIGQHWSLLFAWQGAGVEDMASAEDEPIMGIWVQSLEQIPAEACLVKESGQSSPPEAESAHLKKVQNFAVIMPRPSKYDTGSSQEMISCRWHVCNSGTYLPWERWDQIKISAVIVTSYHQQLYCHCSGSSPRRLPLNFPAFRGQVLPSRGCCPSRGRGFLPPLLMPTGTLDAKY